LNISEGDAPPIISNCPSNITQGSDAGVCNAVVNWTAPTVNNDYELTSFSPSHSPGSTFNVGTTNVTYTAIDETNTVTCTFSVTVNDTENPSLSCSNTTVNSDAGQCNANVTVPQPTATDNCGVVSLINSQTGTSNASGNYPVGSTAVTWTATDAAGNTATCSVSINVTDNEAPVASCIADFTQTADAGVCNAAVTVANPTVSDNCGVASTVNNFNSTSNANDTYNVGATTVVFTVTDIYGNTSTCDVVVTVEDDENPVITCPPSITQDTDPGVCTAAVTVAAITNADNCGVTSIVNDFNSTSNASDTYNLGTNTVTWTVGDAAGNTTTCSMVVEIEDNENPTITCPASITQDTDPGVCTAAVTVGAPTIGDNCSGATFANDFNSTADASDTYSLGANTVVWTVTDGSGNTATCDITVLIEDNENPTITCPASITQTADASVCSAAVTVGAPTTGDNCSVASTINNFNSTSDATDTYNVGTTIVIWTVTDGSANTTTCSMTVTITDDENPSITCPADITQANDAGVCNAAVTVPAPATADNCGVMTTVNDFNSTADASDTYTVGLNTVNWTVTDTAGNTATCSMTVTIQDTENPVIMCTIPFVFQPNDADSCNAVVTPTPPSFSDNCDASITNDYTGTDDATAIYPVGGTTVAWTATDTSGNTAMCLQTVLVLDSQAPTVVCPSDMSQTADAGVCEAAVTIPVPTEDDNCAVTLFNNDYNGGSDASGTYPVGVTTVTWTVGDGAGGTATCSIDVTITDDEAPMYAGCPSDITQGSEPGLCLGIVSWTVPTVTDNCNVATSSNTHNPGPFPLGVTTVTYSATDDSGNTAECTFNVEVIDTELPTITCPNDTMLMADAGLCTANLVSPAPTTTDNCGVQIENDFNNTSDASDDYPVGMTTVMYTATDSSGNTATCSFDVTVDDDEDPTITCPSSFTQSIDAGSCDAATTITVPTTADNCGVMTVENDFNNTDDASDTYPVGTTTVLYTVTDSAGNTATCSFDVTIDDDEDPVVTCPSDITQDTDAGSCDAAVTVPAIVAMDNCAIASIDNDFNNTSDASDTYPLGLTTVMVTVTDDAGLTADCSFSVLINDNEDPVITCPADVTQSNDAGNCDASVTLANATATDNCTVAGVMNDYNSTADPSDTYALGTTMVLFSATDGSGNVSTCTMSITIEDDEDPTVTCPASVTQTADADSCNAAVTIGLPTSADNCAIMSVLNDYNSGSDASDIYPVGTTTVVYTATDSSSNMTTCSFDVTIEDDEDPTITCPADMTQGTDAGSCDAAVTVSGEMADDNCAVMSVMNDFNNTTDHSDTYPLGTTTVTLTAMDAGGNMATCSFDITIEDDEDPTIACPSDITQDTDAGSCDAAVTVPAATDADNCAVASVVNDFNSTSDASDTYAEGTTTVVFTVTDNAGNTGSCSFDITIEDNEEPVVTCPSDIMQDTDAGSCDAAVTVPAASATDNCGGIASITNDFNSTSDASDTYANGATTVVFSATDTDGNVGTCSFVVTINDMEAPAITCPADITQANDTDSCNASVTVPALTTSDNCGVMSVLNDYNNTSDASDTYAVGTTTVSFSALDGAGNMSTCVMAITIEDQADPSITCPAGVTQTADLGVCEAAVTIGAATGADNCVVASIENDFNNTSDASDTYPVGSTTVVFTAMDDAGNMATCSIDVTIEDDEDPMITCPSDLTQPADAGECDAAITFAAPTFSDNCSATVENDFNNTSDASDTYPLGTTTVMLTATDASGNTATCSFDVTVRDDESPVFANCPTAPIVVSNDAGMCGAIVTWDPVSPSDNCFMFPPVASHNSGDMFPVGTTTVTTTVTDVGGNLVQCIFDVVVNDDEDPALTCPADVAQDTDAGSCDAVVTIPVPTHSDNCTISLTNDFNNTMDASDTYPTGTTVVTWTASDTSGNVSTCAINVVITDNELPTITCPASITQDTDTDSCNAMVTIAVPTTTENCTVASFMNDYNGMSDASGIYSLGTTTVAWTITDDSGNSASCSIDVIIEDNFVPVVTCPADITANTDPGACEATITIAPPTIDENCGIASAINDFTGGLDASGTYPTGVTTVEWFVSDVNGNDAGCTMTVTVEENEAPVITCPANIATSTDTTLCKANVTVAVPTTSDNCAVVSLTNDITGTSDASNLYNVGTTTVTWTVADANGNTSTCSITIDVTDNELPFISCAPDITQATDSGFCGAAVNVTAPLIADNCGVSTLVNDYNNTSDGLDTYSVGTTTVVWTVDDLNGNSSSCSMTVTVEDDQDPTIACPTDVSQNTDIGSCDAAVSVGFPTVSDECNVGVATNDFNSTSDASDTYPEGMTTVVWSVNDLNGNASTCAMTVTVMDMQAPSITCPADMTEDNNPGQCTGMVTVPAPTGVDNCGSITFTNDFNNTSDASDAYPQGETTVTWTGSDASGNTSSCSFTILIKDIEAPMIMGCPADITESALAGDCSADVMWVEPTPTDNCAIASTSQSHTPGETFFAGTTTLVIYSVVDNDGNESSCGFNVTVVDNEAPVITICPSDATIPVNQSCDAVVNVPSPATTDNCGVLSITNDYNNTSNATDTYPSGNTVVMWTVSDVHGNTASCSHEIFVSDSEVPTISCPANVNQSVSAGQCDANVSILAPTFGDNCPTGLVLTNDYNGTSDASGIYPTGTTTVTWTISDASSNTASCAFDVTINDTQAPVITDCSDRTVSIGPGECVVDSFPPITYMDCPNSTVDYMPGGPYSSGVHAITAMVTDASGNTATCSFNLTVTGSTLGVDAGADATFCLGTLTATATNGTGSYSFTWSVGSQILGTTASIDVVPDSTTTYTVTVDDGVCVVSDQVTVTVNALAMGTNCSNAEVLSGLPFSASGMSTECALNDYSSADGCTSLYLDGPDYVYEYTPSVDEDLNVVLSNTDNEVGLFIFEGCPDDSNSVCVGTATSPSGNPSLTGMSIRGGATYYIVVSTLADRFTGFDVTVSSTPSSCGRDVFESNETMGDAKMLPQIGVNRNARICPIGDIDTYMFIVGEKTNINVKLGALDANCELDVIYNGTTFSSTNPSRLDENVTLNNLNTGDIIYIQVYGAVGVSNDEGYSLHVVQRDQAISMTPRPMTPGSVTVVDLPSKDDDQTLISIEEGVNFTLYPNPAREELFIAVDGLDKGDVQFVMYNATGQVVIRETWKLEGSEVNKVNLSALPEGVYYYRVRSGTHTKSGEIIHMY